MSNNHEHGESSSKKLRIVSLINIIGFVVELFGGLAFGSIALLSDVFHMLFDATAYIIFSPGGLRPLGWGGTDVKFK